MRKQRGQDFLARYLKHGYRYGAAANTVRDKQKPKEVKREQTNSQA